jgi:hypothetical protein
VIHGEAEQGKPLWIEILDDFAYPFVVRVVIRGEGI